MVQRETVQMWLRDDANRVQPQDINLIFAEVFESLPNYNLDRSLRISFEVFN